MADLITPQELAVWSQTDLETITDDPFAAEVMQKASDLVRAIAQQPDWEIAGDTPIPFEARMLVLKIARRTYVNPDQEVSSTTGPISSRVADEAAMAMTLSEEDRNYLESLSDDGDEGLWVLSPGGGLSELRTIYLQTEPQPNLGDMLPWEIPYGDTRESDFFTTPEDVYI